MKNKTVEIKSSKIDRVILVADQIVFIHKDGSVTHCNGSNRLMEEICGKSAPVTASTRLD